MKKFLALLLAVALTAGISVAGTVAYLTSEDSDVNVMTVGNVKIAQNEYEWNADSSALQDFTQAKPILPYVGTMGWNVDTTADKADQAYRSFTMENVVDKYVTVENTGKSDAYVRTLFAFEMGSFTTIEDYKYKVVGYSYNNENGTEFPEMDWVWSDEFIAQIDQKNYLIRSATYVGGDKDGVLAPKQETIPSLLQLYISKDAGNDECAKLDGNGNGTLDVLVLSQAVQSSGFDTAAAALKEGFGDVTKEKVQEWFGDGAVEMPVLVSSAEDLQTALNDAVKDTTIVLADDIAGDVTATQKKDVKITIDGAGHTFDGTVTVDGKSSRYETAALAIQNVNFSSAAINADAFINLGRSGDTNTRYTNNVTVSHCTFNTTSTEDVVAIKSYTGGDWNLIVDGCTVGSGMHSMMQVTNVEKGLTITDCHVSSKNGVNLNNTPWLEMSGCEFNTQGYCVRVGVNGSVNSDAKSFSITDSALTSANDDGDAAIIIRTNATNSTLTLTNTTYTNISGNTSATTINN